MAKYLAVGQVNCDVIVDDNGNTSEVKIGGSGLFALAGIRIFTPDCALVTKLGRNFAREYLDWFEANGVTADYAPLTSDTIPAHYLRYTHDGLYENVAMSDPRYDGEILGYMHPKADDLERALCPDTAGFSIYQDTDSVQWSLLRRAANRVGAKIMWEANHRARDPERIKQVAPIPEMWSINSNEVEQIFGIPKANEMDAIELLRGITNELCFYRVGKKGSYAITRDGAWFCPAIDPTGESVDPTGCGNCSIGAAMYAYASGNSPDRVAVMANVASGYNAAQLGPVPRFTPELTREALELVERSMALVKRV